MTKWTYFKSLLRLIISGKPKKWKLETDHTMKVAFYSGGKPYYELSDSFDTHCERGLQAYQSFEEVSMRIDVSTLKEFVKKFKELLTQNPINILETARVLNFLEERINFVIPPQELVWKMAAVKYIGEKESPYIYDTMESEEKIRQWKKNGDIDSFFLHQRLGDLMPSPKLSKETYRMLQETLSKMINYQSKSISGKTSDKKEEASTFSEN